MIRIWLLQNGSISDLFAKAASRLNLKPSFGKMALFKKGRRNRRGQISKVPLSRVAHERKPRLHFARNSYELDHPFHIYEHRPRKILNKITFVRLALPNVK